MGDRYDTKRTSPCNFENSELVYTKFKNKYISSYIFKKSYYALV